MSPHADIPAARRDLQPFTRLRMKAAPTKKPEALMSLRLAVVRKIRPPESDDHDIGCSDSRAGRKRRQLQVG